MAAEFLLPTVLIAQVPGVTSVWGTFAPGGLSPGVRATVQGGNFSRDAMVEIGTGSAAVLGLFYDDWGGENAGFEYLVVVLPMELPAGETTLVVTTAAGSSVPFPIHVDEYAPALFSGFFLGRKAVNCAPAGETPVAGAIVTANAVGLGPTNSGLNSATLVNPRITVGGQPAHVIESALTSEPGWYQVSFRVPPGDGYHEVVLEIAGRRSNPLFLPVGKGVISWGNPLGVTATESIMTAAACGGTFANANRSADPRSPPLSLDGTTVTFIDSHGVERLARLLFVSPGQVNYIVPAGTAAGVAAINVASDDGSVSTGTVEIRSVAPRLFTVSGIPAGAILLIRNGVQTQEAIFESGGNGVAAIPIDLGPPMDQVFLMMFGTGLRHASNVRVTIGGIDCAVSSAGPHSEMPGMDQVTVRLPRSLAGSRNAEVRVTANEALAEITFLSFR
jgi:uncharacterized protein (TIGR03437 family)